MTKKLFTVIIFIISALITILMINSCIESDYPALSEPPGTDYYALFNGRDFTGWDIGDAEPGEGAWIVVDGVIHCKGKPFKPYLILTEKDYENFDFYAEFKIVKGCNSGIFYYVPLAGRESRLGFETQILDDHGEIPNKNSSGSIYDVVPPLENAMKPAGKWNQYHVVFDWPNCKIWLNGKLVQDIDFYANPLLKYRLRRGPIGLSNHGHEVDFRNLWIKELPDKDAGETVFNGEDLTGWTSIGDADWHVEDGMITSTKGEGYLITDHEFEDIYFHAYVDNDTLRSRDACLYYRWKSVYDPGYPVHFYDFKEAAKYAAKYGKKIPSPKSFIIPIRSSWLLFRIISNDSESDVYLNEHLISHNTLLRKSPLGKIAIYRTPGDGVIRIKNLKFRNLEGPGI